MKRYIKTSVVLGLLMVPCMASAQFFTNSALNLSEVKLSGTARFQGIGGNHAALGGDMSTAFGNPAGLAFYNRSELSISPVIYNNTTTSNYINAGNMTDRKGNFNIGHFGVVFAGDPSNRNSDWKRTAFAVSYSRNSTLTNKFQYGGQNNASSFVDWAVERSGNLPFDVLDREYNANRNLAQSIESAFLNLYLMDDTTPNGPPYRRAIPLKGAAAVQNGTMTAMGSTGQWSFAYSGNFDDKLYVGASLGLWKSTYEYQHNMTERFTNAAPFIGLNYAENLSLIANGLNLSAGFIYKATDYVQLGGYINSPTFTTVRTTFNEELGVDLSGDVPLYSASGQPIKNPQGQQLYQPLKYKTIPVEQYDFVYDLTSPMRAGGGATFFVGKKGFLTATAEYVGYNGMRMNTSYYDNSQDNETFKTNKNKDVKNTFANVVNIRAGGEARLGSFRVRAGGAYLPSPYRSTVDGLDRTRFQYSGGLGYRDNKYFVDVAATVMQSQDAYSPYVMNDPRRTPSAKISNSGLNVAITGGILF